VIGVAGRSERSGKVRNKLVRFQKRLRTADYILFLFCATDIEQLIAGVYARQALWEQKHVNNHNRGVNDKLWEEIAVSLGSNSNFNVGHPVVHITTLL
jgi:hypothetical protein